MFKSKLTTREYRSFLKSELEDVVLSPQIDKTASNNLDVLLQDRPDAKEPIIKPSNPHHYNFNYSQPRKPKIVLLFTRSFTIPNRTTFQKLWEKLPTSIALHITGFLSIKSALSLAGACKTFNSSLKHKVYVQKLEKHLHITLEENNNNSLLDNTSYLRSFYKSLHYSLTTNSVLTTKTMLPQEDYLEEKMLAKNMIDFSPINNLKTLETLTGKKLWLPTIFLSYDSNLRIIKLWTLLTDFALDVLFRDGDFALHVLFRHDLPKSKELISVRLLSDEFLVIQTREKTTTPQELANSPDTDEFSILNIHRWTVKAMEGKHCDISMNEFDHSFKLEYKIMPAEDSSHIERSNALKMQVDKTYSTKYCVCFDHQERLFFYTKEFKTKTIIFAYNLAAQRLEEPLVLHLDGQLHTIVSPKKKIEGKMQLLVIYGDLKVKTLSYDKSQSNYSVKQLNYSGKILDSQNSNESFCHQKYQLGSFTDNKGNLVEYLLLLKNNELFFIDINSLMSRKILTITLPNGNTQSCWKDNFGTVEIYGSITSWHADEDKIAVALNNTHLVVFAISPQGELTKISADHQLLVSQSKWESKSHSVYELSEKPTKHSQELERSKLPLYMFINNSRLILVSFPTLDQSFNIYFASLPEILFSKNQKIWNPQKSQQHLPVLNIQRTRWEVHSEDIFNYNPKSFFKECNQNKNYNELCKFEDNKLLLKLGSLNLYFDFESDFCALPNRNQTSLEAHKSLQVNLPDELKPRENRENVHQENKYYPPQTRNNTKDKKLVAKNNKQKEVESEPQVDTLQSKKKGKKHQFEETDESFEEKKIEPSKSRKQTRKKEFQDFKNANIWDAKTLGSPFYYLKKSVDLKQQFLKLFNKRKGKDSDKKYTDRRSSF